MRRFTVNGARWWIVLGLLVPGGRVVADGPPAAAPAVVADDGDDLEGLAPFGIRNLAYRLKALGGDASTRLPTVAAGLRWLQAHQAEDGSWPSADLGWCDGKKRSPPDRIADGPGKPFYTVGTTALSVLALIAAGNDHRDGGPFATTIRRGLAWLVAAQDAEGCFGERTTQHYVYNHGFAAEALLQAFAVTGDPALRRPAQRALDFTMSARNPYFGWRYGVQPGDNDTSVTVLMLIGFLTAWNMNGAALEAGRREPFDLPLLRPREVEDHPLTGGLTWLDKMTDTEYGRAGYIQPGSGPARPQEQVERFPTDRSESMTAAMLAARLLLPREVPRRKDEETVVRRSVGLLAALPPRWNREDGSIDLYYWYYGALAMSLRGGAEWKAFDAALMDALLKGQRVDGTACDVLGSWDNADPWGPDGGRTYSTAMALLALTAPGRDVRVAPDAKEIAARLGRADVPDGEKRRLLSVVAFHRLAGVETAVLSLVGAKDENLRAAALDALVATDPSSRALSTLAAALGDASPATRVAAARASERMARPEPSLVEPLRALLTHADAGVRAAGARALARHGAGAKAAEAELLALAKDPAPHARVAAAQALLASDPTSAPAGEALALALRDPDAEVRADAARAALARTGPDAALDAALKDAVGDADARAAALAALAGRRRGMADDRIPAVLGRGLAVVEPGLVTALLDALAEVGAPARVAMPEVAARAHRGSRGVRPAAAKALVRIGGEAVVVHLYALLEDPLPEVRKTAQDGIAALALAPAALGDHLRLALRSPDPDQVRGAKQGFRILGVAGLPALRTAVEESATDPALFRRVLGIVVDLGDVARPLAAPVGAILAREKDPALALLAAQALERFGTAPPEVVPALEGWAHSGDEAMGPAAARTLGAVAASLPQAMQSIADLVRDKGLAAPVRAAAVAAAGKAGAGGTLVLNALLELVTIPKDDPLRSPLIDSLAALGPSFVKTYREILKTGRWPEVAAVVEAISRMGPAGVPFLPDMVDRLKLPNDVASGLTDAALSRMGEAAVKPVLRALPHVPKGKEVRVIWILGEIGPPAKEALPTLRKFQKSNDANLVNAANEAIKKIGG